MTNSICFNSKTSSSNYDNLLCHIEMINKHVKLPNESDFTVLYDDKLVLSTPLKLDPVYNDVTFSFRSRGLQSTTRLRLALVKEGLVHLTKADVNRFLKLFKITVVCKRF